LPEVSMSAGQMNEALAVIKNAREAYEVQKIEL